MADMHFGNRRRRSKFFTFAHPGPSHSPEHDLPRPPVSAEQRMIEELRHSISPAALDRLLGSGEFDRIMGLEPAESGPEIAAAPTPQAAALQKQIQRTSEDSRSQTDVGRITDPTEFCRVFFAELEPQTSAMIFDNLRALQERKEQTDDLGEIMKVNRLVRELQVLRERLRSLKITCQQWEKRDFLDQATARFFNRDDILGRLTAEAQGIARRVREIGAGLADLGM